jgi:hypothetical protein
MQFSPALVRNHLAKLIHGEAPLGVSYGELQVCPTGARPGDGL